MSYTRKPACVNRVIFGAFSVLAWTQGAVTSLITTWGVHRKISVKMIIKCSLYCIAWNVVLKVSLHTNNEGNGNIFKLDLPNPDNAIFLYKYIFIIAANTGNTGMSSPADKLPRGSFRLSKCHALL